MSQIAVKINEKEGTIQITLPLEEEPTESKSRKSLTIASTHGNFRSDASFQGKPVMIGVNAYVLKKKSDKDK
jgi:hypothetical protein